MPFVAWLLLGAGVFLMYSAYKGFNPVSHITNILGG